MASSDLSTSRSCWLINSRRRARVWRAVYRSVFIHAVMGAEADATCGAGYRQCSDERSNSSNGYRPLDFDTRAGTIDVAIPKLRSGSYFPGWLLERRKRAERALKRAW